MQNALALVTVSDVELFSRSMSAEQKPEPLPGPGVFPTFLYYFSATALIVTYGASAGLNIGLTSGFPLQSGILTGLIAGCAGAYFSHTTSFTIDIPAPKRAREILENVEAVLHEQGFEYKLDIDGYKVYERPIVRTLFAGKVFLKVEAKQVLLASRARTIRQLKPHLQ